MMKTRSVAPTILLAGLLASGSITLHGLPQSAVTFAQWFTFTDAIGRFSVLLPGSAPVDRPTDDGRQVSHVFRVEAENTVYVTAYSDSDSPDINAFFNEARDSFLNGMAATLVSEHRFRSTQPAGEVQASEFTCQNPAKGLECKARTYFYLGRGYMTAAVRYGARTTTDTERFLDSFRIFPTVR